MPKFKKDNASQLLGDKLTKEKKGSLSKLFDDNNGDFDTPGEFLRAYLKRDPRALSALSLQNREQLGDILEPMFPEIREIMKEETLTPRKLQQYLAELADKKTPNPIP